MIGRTGSVREKTFPRQNRNEPLLTIDSGIATHRKQQ